MRAEVERLVEEVIRPLVRADGGEVRVESVTDEEIILSLGDSCAGCPGAHYTGTHVIEPALRTVVGPDVQIHVRAVPAPRSRKITARPGSSP